MRQKVKHIILIALLMSCIMTLTSCRAIDAQKILIMFK